MPRICTAQENKPGQSPSITLYLPPNIASETVDITYVLAGPFGGYGGFVPKEKGRVSFEIPASVDGKPVEAANIFAYMPGCEYVRLKIAMQGASEARTIPCEPMGTVPLEGRISPVSFARMPGVEIEVSYLSDWDYKSVGIMDGPMTSIRVATVIPDHDGRFKVDLPDFLKQDHQGKGEFQFLLRYTVSQNIIAALKPQNQPQVAGDLDIQHSYAPFVLFSVDTSEATYPPPDAGVAEQKAND